MTDKHLTWALTRTFPVGTLLFEENDPGSRMYVIRRGRVKIYRRFADNEMLLALLGPGEFFGEMALLENLPRSATAMVVEEAELIEVDGHTFESMIRSNSEIAVRLMRKLASRVRELDRRLQNLLVESGTGRAIEVLRWLIPTGTPEGPYTRIPGSRAHVSIAAQAGITPAEAEDVLARLRRAGCIKQDHGDVLIASVDVLSEYSSFLDLKRRFEPPTGRGAAETLGAGKDDQQRSLARLLNALQIPNDELETRQAALAHQYRQYVRLRQRFEPKEESGE